MEQEAPPPRAVHGVQWPEPLRPYHEIYHAMSPSLASTEHLTNDEANFIRCKNFRCRMTKLLRAHIDLTAVESVLYGLRQGTGFSREALQWFLRLHRLLSSCFPVRIFLTIRWATNPILKVAQQDKTFEFLLELEIPWNFLCSRYGICFQGGNFMSNHLCDFNVAGEMVYKVNEGMSDTVQFSEYYFIHIFVEMEESVSSNLVISTLKKK